MRKPQQPQPRQGRSPAPTLGPTRSSPASKKPADSSRATARPHDKPVYEKPAYEKPVRENFAREKPIREKPAHEKPGREKPAHEKATYEKPTYEKPAHDRPPVERAEPRNNPGETWLWGRHAVLAALGNPDRKILRLVATEEIAAELAGKPDLLDNRTVQTFTRDALQRLLPTGAIHQGMALLSRPLPALSIEDLIDRSADHSRAVIVALDQVTDPHNVGAIMRSAAAFGALAVVTPDRHAPDVAGTLAKSASGAVEHVPLVNVVNLSRTLEQLKKAGFWIVGLAGETDATLASHRLTGKIVIVLGSEGEGLRRLTRENCDLMAKLPTSGPIASLNVSNAAAIALYELARAID